MTATSICSAILSGEFSRMSKLDAAMDKHMNNIVFEEHRPFSFLDFQRFEVDGKVHTMVNGTIRNKVSQLMKADKVEREYISGHAFYTIKGVHFGKQKHKPARMMMMAQPMTPNHMEVSSVTGVTAPSSASPTIINPNPHYSYTTCDDIIQNLPPNNNSTTYI
jgi:hypothetical protein